MTARIGSLLGRACGALVWLLVAGCSPLPAAAPPGREPCLNAAGEAFMGRVASQCAASGYTACPARPAIDAQLQADQEACP